MDLHEHMVAVSRIVVNQDGRRGTAMFRDQGGVLKKHTKGLRFTVNLDNCAGPQGFWYSSWRCFFFFQKKKKQG